MSTPKNNPDILQDWCNIFSEYTAQGMKKSNIYYSIAKAYGVSYSTVRYYLNPAYRICHMRSERERNRRQARSRKHIRTYNRNYRRLTRNPERFLAVVFQSVEQATPDEISTSLLEFTEGVSFRPATIQKILDKYIREERGPPYLKVHDNIYCGVTDPYAERPQCEPQGTGVELLELSSNKGLVT